LIRSTSDRCDVKAQAIILNLQYADFFEDFLEPFEVVFSLREEVRISGWPMGLFCPKLEKQRSLENEGVSVWRVAYAVQNPLQRVFGQKKIEVFFFGPGSIEKALLRGCGGVGRNSLAQIRDSIYGRMTLTTRHTLAARHSSSMEAFFSRYAARSAWIAVSTPILERNLKQSGGHLKKGTATHVKAKLVRISLS
jgi:hypothetical protein